MLSSSSDVESPPRHFAPHPASGISELVWIMDAGFSLVISVVGTW